MKTRVIRLTDEQDAALLRAASAAGISVEAFAQRAVRVLAAQYGVEIPERKVRIQAYKDRRRGGRPVKPLTPIEKEVPAGEFVRICPRCERAFRTDTPSAVYCSSYCKRSSMNRRNYLKRKERKNASAR